MKGQIFIFLLVGFIGCINFKSRKDHKYTIELCKLKSKTCNCNLYIEGYTVSRAFGSTDIVSEYLTDSNSFRIYMGNFDEGNERLNYNCGGTPFSTKNELIKILEKIGIHFEF